MVLEQIILDAAELSAEPPSEITLLKAGWTETKKGRFLFDEQAQDEVLASAKVDGRDLIPFDIGHGMLTGTDEGRHKAAGWFKLAVNQDGDLLASEIEWTPKTREALENREYRFHSPAFLYNGKTRRVSCIKNVALTNMPATNNQTPIVLDSNDIHGGDPHKKDNYKMSLVALLGVTEDKVEETVALLHREHAELLSKHSQAEAKYEEVAKELADMKASALLDARKAEVAILSSEGKITPAAVAFAESLSSDNFEAYKATLSAESFHKKSSDRAAEDGDAMLSDIEKEAARISGVSEAEFILAKKASA